MAISVVIETKPVQALNCLNKDSIFSAKESTIWTHVHFPVPCFLCFCQGKVLCEHVHYVLHAVYLASFQLPWLLACACMQPPVRGGALRAVEREGEGLVLYLLIFSIYIYSPLNPTAEKERKKLIFMLYYEATILCCQDKNFR